MTTLTAVYLQIVQGLSPQQTGLLLLMQPVLMAVLSPFTGRLSDKVGSRVLATTGMVLVAAGMVQLAYVSEFRGAASSSPSATIGVGMAVFSAPNISAVMGSVDRSQLNLASGFLATMRFAGQGLSIAVLGAIAAWRLGAEGGRVILLGEAGAPLMRRLRRRLPDGHAGRRRPGAGRRRSVLDRQLRAAPPVSSGSVGRRGAAGLESTHRIFRRGAVMAFGKYAVDYEQRVDYPRLRRERVARVKAQMEADGIGAIITWDPDNIRYIASYYVTTPMRASEMQAVFIARNGEPHLIGGGTPSETARRMPWLAGVQPSYGMPRLSARDSSDALIEAWVDGVAKLMADYGVEKETAGRRRHHPAGALLRGLRRKGITTIHGRPVMDYARMIKTVDEIELIKIACANAEQAHAAMADAIRPGVRECDLVASASRSSTRRGPTTPRTWSA